MSLDTGFTKPIQISTTLWSYNRSGKGGTRTPRSLLTDVGLWHKKSSARWMTLRPSASTTKTQTECFPSSFVAGLAWVAGRQTRFSTTQSLDQDLKIALTFQEAEKQKTFSESFYANLNDSLKLRSPGRTRHYSHEHHGSAEARRADNRKQTQRAMTSRGRNRPKTSANRNEETKVALRCYECEGFGHFARECATRLHL